MSLTKIPVETLRVGDWVSPGNGSWFIMIHRVRQSETHECCVDVLYSFVGEPDDGLKECPYEKGTELKLFNIHEKRT